jgi:hypothetical protein|nr:MAG TPA: hypothetical protein [Caudoviricetes sp.]
MVMNKLKPILTKEITFDSKSKKEDLNNTSDEMERIKMRRRILMANVRARQALERNNRYKQERLERYLGKLEHHTGKRKDE